MLRRAERTAGVLLISLAAAEVLVTSLVSLGRSIAGGHPITPYVAPQYWLGYQHGFVRRALPGAVLRWCAGGQPGYGVVNVVGVALSVAAALAVVALALLLARRASSRAAALGIAAVVLSAPLSVSLYLRDLGRVDAVGVVLLVVLVVLPWRRWPTAVVLLGLAGLTTIAVAAGELLVVLVVPVALLTARAVLAERVSRPGLRTVWAAVAVLPCLLVAALSAVLPAPPATLAEATAAARAAGVPPSVPLVPGLQDHDSVSRLRYGLVDNITDYYATTTVTSVLVSTVLWAAVFTAVVGVVWHLLGHSVRDRTLHVLLAGYGLAALALSVAAIDYRRWWALATLAALATVLQLGSSRSRPALVSGPVATAVLIGLAVAGVVLQATPVWPLHLADLPLLSDAPR